MNLHLELNLDSIISNVIEPRIDESAPLCYEEREEIYMLFFDVSAFF